MNPTAYRFESMECSSPLALRFFTIALCLVLAGCFTSAQPKFPLTSAVAAFGEGGRYVSYERKDDGHYEKDETFTVRHRPDGAYDFIDSKGEPESVSLHRIGPDLYVAQGVAKDKNRTDYVVLRGTGQEMVGYAPECSKQDATKMEALGVEIRRQECVIDRVADPAGLFTALDLGAPTSKLVRE